MNICEKPKTAFQKPFFFFNSLIYKGKSTGNKIILYGAPVFYCRWQPLFEDNKRGNLLSTKWVCTCSATKLNTGNINI